MCGWYLPNRALLSDPNSKSMTSALKRISELQQLTTTQPALHRIMPASPAPPASPPAGSDSEPESPPPGQAYEIEGSQPLEFDFDGLDNPPDSPVLTIADMDGGVGALGIAPNTPRPPSPAHSVAESSASSVPRVVTPGGAGKKPRHKKSWSERVGAIVNQFESATRGEVSPKTRGRAATLAATVMGAIALCASKAKTTRAKMDELQLKIDAFDDDALVATEALETLVEAMDEEGMPRPEGFE